MQIKGLENICEMCIQNKIANIALKDE